MSAALAAAPAAFALGGGEASAQDPGGAGAAGPPNVVVVMTDDQDARSVRVMETISRIGRRGTTFENFFATFPLCCPSRATFFTGQYAHNHGVRDNRPPDGGYRAFDDRGSLAPTLQAAGYRTGFVGKYLNGYGDPRLGGDPDEIPRGWTEWYGKTEGELYDYTLNENGRLRHYGDDRRDYQTDVLARKAVGFIGRSARRHAPFFLTLSTQAPHDEEFAPPRPAPRHRGAFRDEPLAAPPSFNERDVSDKPSFVSEHPRLTRQAIDRLRRLYRARLASLLAVDEAVARLLEELRRTGELSNTLVIFTSDNGYLLGEHRLSRKTLLYEESAKVPLVMRGPGVPAGATLPQVTGNIDLAPTILDVADVEPRLVMDGRSLLPLAADPALSDGRDMLLENDRSLAVRTSRFMYAEHPDGEVELYDLDRDPYQLVSRHGDPSYNAVQRQLAARLMELEGCGGEQCR